ncbi:aspartate kinase [Ruminiclostridium sufflavum DSM 19573]|uniref:Aspartokinase n=1 Tax=Ruminiclostridium sufflavum DSM 19573 TaxID=1121337 RepID=A0A318XKW1_9FIRM|nr:aspartate kinase [Ruminiclostridium sufflavum]PYG87013.1 aspartate kinase [Ruminiclostridium sufflavum DSM 19573]
MKVAKFGGTSLANAEQIKKVCDIVLSDSDRKIIVVSAPGKREKSDTKVTDLLIACAEKQLADGNAVEELNAVVKRFKDIADDLKLGDEIINEIKADLEGRLKLDTSHKGMFMDAMKAAGEDNSAKLVAAYLNSIGKKAQYVSPKQAGLLLSSEFGNAQVLPESFENLKMLCGIDGIIIFPGFFGYTAEGNVATFPRGGSDITGSILAAALKVDLYENFTDVDAVYAAHPGLVNNPVAISEITYREMRELSYAGFSVLHEDTLIPVFKAGVPVNIKNTNNPTAPGTKIVLSRDYSPNSHVVGIASDDSFCCIYVSKFMMNREIGFGRKLLQILEDEGISYEHTPSGIDNISIIFKQSQIKNTSIEQKILARIKNELNCDDVSIDHGLAMIIIVGEGMKNTVGTASRATTALAKASISLEMINQGSSEVTMMFGVRQYEAHKAVISLYNEFFNRR